MAPLMLTCTPNRLELSREELMEDIDPDFVLQVSLLAEPCLWCWEIREGIGGRLVEGSWANEWVAFGSQAEAVAAGARRLAELAMPRSAARAAA
jgi:hypothetical protein